MTIKQSGGIFGRNPTFNDVAVDGTLSTNELSVSGSFAVDDITIENNKVSSTGALLLQAGNNLNVITPLDGNSNNTLIVDAIGRTAYGISNTTLQLEAMGNDGATNRGSHYTLTAGGTSAWGGSELRFGYFSDGTDYGTRMTLTNAGNLSFPSGKGIDFSATSGTGTSELFDDYEEGTWTPTVTSSSGTLTTVTIGTGNNAPRYTKVGSIVNYSVYFQLSNIGTGGGSLTVAGLPFPSLSDYHPQIASNPSTGVAGFCSLLNSSIIGVVKYDSSQLFTTSGQTLTISGTYHTN